MQLPALFGHQAFANDAYEVYDFSAERLALQTLLHTDTWSDAIEGAARTFGWTHVVVRTDFVHPESIPLELLFDGATDAAYRFATR